MHYFSNLFDKIHYMFQTGPLSIIRSISTLYTQQYTLVLLVSASRCQQNKQDKYLLHVYSVEILLMMGSGPIQNR
jgi:hypothetical protein